MKDTADIKRENKSQIRKLLISGNSYTKQQVSLQTGLSVASCNTYLNEMAITGEVIGEKQKLNDVGRNAVVYKLNENFESILCIYFELIQGIKSITTAVFSPIGRLLHKQTVSNEVLDSSAVIQTVSNIMEQFPNVSQIMVGTPSIAENGVIRHSDIEELEDVPLKSVLEERFLPGTATVHKGVLLTGKNLFAGMVGFMDYGISQEQQIKKLQRPTAEPFIIKAAIALISILNPHQLLFTGDLLHKEDLNKIYIACKKCIPEEYMPEFVFLPDTEEYYLKGMYWTAIDTKENVK